MQFIPSFLYGISSSLDALLVGIGLGLKGIRISFRQNCLISFVTLLGTCLSVGLGGRLTRRLPSSAVSCAGSIILIILGLYYILKWGFANFSRQKKQACSREITLTSHADTPSALTRAQVLLFGVTLSANNMGMGLAASMTGLSVTSAALSTAICSVLFLLAGNRLGTCRLLLFIGRFADPLSGALLIGIGFSNFGHSIL